jgi:ADP-ribose pyrophosphatase
MADEDITWERIEPTTVTKVGWRTVTSKTFRMPDGSLKVWDTNGTEGSRTVATLALTPDNNVIVAYMYRPGIEGFMYELPGGGVDGNEGLENAARRELQEETGYEASTMEYLGKAYIDAHSNNQSNFFLATGCTISAKARHLDDEEFIVPKLITISELFIHARAGRITDVPAVFLAYEQLKTLQEKA